MLIFSSSACDYRVSNLITTFPYSHSVSSFSSALSPRPRHFKWLLGFPCLPPSLWFGYIDDGRPWSSVRFPTEWSPAGMRCRYYIFRSDSLACVSTARLSRAPAVMMAIGRVQYMYRSKGKWVMEWTPETNFASSPCFVYYWGQVNRQLWIQKSENKSTCVSIIIVFSITRANY